MRRSIVIKENVGRLRLFRGEGRKCLEAPPKQSRARNSFSNLLIGRTPCCPLIERTSAFDGCSLPPITIYANLMEEAKARIEVIDAAIGGRLALPDMIMEEFTCSFGCFANS